MDQDILNDEEKNVYFEAFIEEYKDKNLYEKQQLIINDLKELIGTFQSLCIMHNFKSDILINREIIDVTKSNYTEDDFAEATYTYIQIFKDMLSEFIIPILQVEEETQYDDNVQ